MLIAISNLQADLKAGFTAARDMSSHGNGYGDVDLRNAINQGLPAIVCPEAIAAAQPGDPIKVDGTLDLDTLDAKAH